MTIKVAGVDYKLVMVDKIEDEDDSGQVDSKNCRILAKSGMSPSWFFRTILHEYLHDQRCEWSERQVEEVETLVAVFLFENNFVNLEEVKKLKRGG